MTSYPTTGKSKGDYLSFVSGRNKNGPTTRVELKEKGKKLFKCMPEFANLLLNEGNNIIIDDVLLDDEQLKNYLNRLSSSHTIYFVGVYCKLNIMQEREILRRNRSVGLSNDQFKRVHNGLREYDITIDIFLFIQNVRSMKKKKIVFTFRIVNLEFDCINKYLL